ncbi:unnamed protein product [Arabidopsis halleri]
MLPLLVKQAHKRGAFFFVLGLRLPLASLLKNLIKIGFCSVPIMLIS